MALKEMNSIEHNLIYHYSYIFELYVGLEIGLDSSLPNTGSHNQ